MSSLQNLACLRLGRNRSTSALNQSLSMCEQVMQMLVCREYGRVESEAHIENGLLVVDPLNVRTGVLLENLGMRSRGRWKQRDGIREKKPQVSLI
jgi:hypothetical protein